MFNYKELNEKYMKDETFCTLVNVLRNLIEAHGFLPSEIREGLFYAQYTSEMQTAQREIGTEKQWEQFSKICKDFRALTSSIKGDKE